MGAFKKVLDSQLAESNFAHAHPVVGSGSVKSINRTIQAMVLSELKKLDRPNDADTRDAMLFLLDCWEKSRQPLSVRDEAFVEITQIRSASWWRTHKDSGRWE
jgi:hypothetical protein